MRQEFNKKVRALKSLKTHLLKELDALMETKKELRHTAERLAEQYEDIKDKQKELACRYLVLSHLVKLKNIEISRYCSKGINRYYKRIIIKYNMLLSENYV